MLNSRDDALVAACKAAPVNDHDSRGPNAFVALCWKVQVGGFRPSLREIFDVFLDDDPLGWLREWCRLLRRALLRPDGGRHEEQKGRDQYRSRFASP